MNFRSILYPVLVEPVNTAAETVTESRWHQPLSIPTLRAGLAAAVVAAGCFLAPQNTTAEVVTEDKWHEALSQPTYKGGLSTSIVSASGAINPPPVSTFIEPVTESRWHQPFAQPTYLGGQSIALQTSGGLLAAQNTFPERVSEDKWHQAFSQPTLRTGLPVNLLNGVLAPNVPATIGWYAPLSQPTYTKWKPPEPSLSYGNYVATATSIVTWVGTTITEADSGTISWPVGTVAGDGAIILLFGNGSLTLTGSGYTQDITVAPINLAGSNFSAWHKTSLSVPEIATPPTYTGTDLGGVIVYITQGQTGINYIGDTTNDGGATASITGFTKDANSSLIASLIVDRTTSAQTLVAPAGWTNHSQTATTFFTADSADVISANYSNGTSVDWTGCQSDSSAGAGLWEFIFSAGTVTLESQWHQPLCQPTVLPKFPVTNSVTPPSSPFNETVTESRWHQPLSIPYRPLTLPPLSGNTLAPFAPENITEDKYHQHFSQPTYRAGYPLAVTVSGNYFTPAAPFPEYVSIDRWQQPLSQPTYKTGLSQAVVTSGGLLYPQPISSTIVFESHWHQPLSQPIYRLPITASGPVTPPIAPFPETVTEDRWHQPLSQPTYRAGYPIATTLSGSLAPAAVAPVTLEWVQPFPQPYLIPSRTPLAVTLAGGTNPPISPFLEAVTEDRWHEGLSQPTYRTWPTMVASISGGIMPPIINNTEVVSADRYVQPISMPTRRAGLPTAVLLPAMTYGTPDLPDPPPPPPIGTVWQPLYY